MTSEDPVSPVASSPVTYELRGVQLYFVFVSSELLFCQNLKPEVTFTEDCILSLKQEVNCDMEVTLCDPSTGIARESFAWLNTKNRHSCFTFGSV